MIDETLQEFMTHVEMKNKQVGWYKNEEKGCGYCLTPSHLFVRVDKLELTKEELAKAKAEQKIENKEYKMYDVKKKVPKSEVTKDKKDFYTIVEKQVKATQIYNVSNQIGIHTTYEDEEEAFKLFDEINNKVAGYINE